MMLKCSNVDLFMCIVRNHMDIHGYPDIRRVWIWSDIHAHGYFRGRGTTRQMDMGMDLVLIYPSKPAPLPSLDTSSSREMSHCIPKTALVSIREAGTSAAC